MPCSSKVIRDLSAGNKQKVGIIAALLNKPQLVILDEPFNFLDPTSQNVLKNILTEYNKTTGATVIACAKELVKAGSVKVSVLALGLAKP